MTEHYYTEKPEAEHDIKLVSAHFFEKKFTFKTDAGVFSKNMVDYGSSLLIQSFNIPETAQILDLGCGYGPIGITISSQMKQGEMVFADINERALDLVAENIKLNQSFINPGVKLAIRKSRGFENFDDLTFDYILLNPPIRAGKATIYQLYEDAYSHLVDKGELWIVIQKKQGALSTIEKLETIFSVVEQVERKKGYYILRSIK